MKMYRKNKPEIITKILEEKALPPTPFGLTLFEAMEIDRLLCGGKYEKEYQNMYLDDPLRLNRVLEPDGAQ